MIAREWIVGLFLSLSLAGAASGDALPGPDEGMLSAAQGRYALSRAATPDDSCAVTLTPKWLDDYKSRARAIAEHGCSRIFGEFGPDYALSWEITMAHHGPVGLLFYATKADEEPVMVIFTPATEVDRYMGSPQPPAQEVNLTLKRVGD